MRHALRAHRASQNRRRRRTILRDFIKVLVIEARGGRPRALRPGQWKRSLPSAPCGRELCQAPNSGSCSFIYIFAGPKGRLTPPDKLLRATSVGSQGPGTQALMPTLLGFEPVNHTLARRPKVQRPESWRRQSHVRFGSTITEKWTSLAGPEHLVQIDVDNCKVLTSYCGTTDDRPDRICHQ